MDYKQQLENAKERLEKRITTLKKLCVKVGINYDELAKEDLFKASVRLAREIVSKFASEKPIRDENGNWIEEAYSYNGKLEQIAENMVKLLEQKEIVKGWENKYAVELQKQNALDNLPELFNDLQKYLVEQWDKFDKMRKEICKQEYGEMWALNKAGNKEEYNKLYKLWQVKYNYNGREIMLENDEHIHTQNVKDARNVILDLIDRVSYITGEINDYTHIKTSRDNNGYLILNGYVVGNKGTAKVESIYAGGYNIQRLHIRVLVKEVK